MWIIQNCLKICHEYIQTRSLSSCISIKTFDFSILFTRGGSRISSQGVHLKKLRRAEGDAKIFGVLRVKNHDFTPKNLIFSNFRGAPHPPPLDPLLFTTIYHSQLRDRLKVLVQLYFINDNVQRRNGRFKHLVLGRDKSYKTNKSDFRKNFSETDIISICCLMGVSHSSAFICVPQYRLVPLFV